MRFRTTTINFDPILNTRIDECILKLAYNFRCYLIFNMIKYTEVFKEGSHRILTCTDQLKVSSSVMLRYLNELTRLMIIRSVVISMKILGIGLLIV